MVKINDIFLFYLLIPFVFAELDLIQDEIEKCWPNQRFSHLNYIFGRTFSDEKSYDLRTIFGKYQSTFVGIHNRWRRLGFGNLGFKRAKKLLGDLCKVHEISCFFSSLLQISNLNRAEYFRSTTAGCSPWRSCGIDASSGKKKQFTRICKISKSDDFRIGLRLQIEWRTVGGSVAWCNGGISRKYFAGGWRRTFRGFRWLSLVLQVHGSRQILAKKIKIRHEAL